MTKENDPFLEELFAKYGIPPQPKPITSKHNLVDQILNQQTSETEVRLNPELVVQKIRSVAKSIDSRLNIVSNDDIFYKGSGASRKIKVMLNTQFITSFVICVEKSVDGEVLVGKADFTNDEINAKIKSALEQIANFKI